MNGRIPPFENGPALPESPRLGSATVVDVTYDEPARAPHLRSRIAGNGAAGGAPNSRATGPRPTAAAHAQGGWENEDEIDTQVMGPGHIAPAQTAAHGAALELDWDIDDSNTEKWQPRHAAPMVQPAAERSPRPEARKVQQPRSPSGVRPAAHVPQAPRPAPQPKPAQAVEAASPEDVIEELREQLIEVLERARTSEARAVAAERRVGETDKGHAAMTALRTQLSSTIERARHAEAARAAAERRAQESEQDAQEGLQRLSEQLMFANEQVEASGAQIDEALQRAAQAEQTVQHARSERQLVEETMARALRRASARSSMLFGLSVLLLVGCAAAGYFALYAPMQQRMAAQQALQAQDAARHSQELASLQSRFDSERQELEASRRQLESQLSAAGAAVPAKSGAIEKAPASSKDKASSAAPESKHTMSAARAAPRHRAKAEAASDDSSDDAKPEPKHEKPAAEDKPSSSGRDNDPLEGL